MGLLPISHVLRTPPVMIDTKKNFNKEYLMRNILIVLCIMVAFPAMADEYLGKLSENPYNPDSTSNEYGQHGSKYSSNSINNQYGQYGSKYPPDSINNPYGAGSPYRQDSPTNLYGEGLSIYGDDDG